MTEEDWLGTDAAEQMLSFLRGKSSDRKLLLATCRAYRERCASRPTPVYSLALTICERYADQRTTPGEFRRLISVWLARSDANMPSEDDPEYLTAKTIRVYLMLFLDSVIWGRDMWSDLWTCIPPDLDVAPIIRDVFGNPFRPVTVDPAWLTPATATLAHQMYESRDFSALPILAGALQDAGCDHPDVLAHCRSDGPHTRGCWVVDLVLGRE